MATSVSIKSFKDIVEEAPVLFPITNFSILEIICAAVGCVRNIRTATRITKPNLRGVDDLRTLLTAQAAAIFGKCLQVVAYDEVQ